MYGCTKCGKGFHVNCFTRFHFTKGLQGNMSMVNDVIRGITLAQENEKCREKVSKSCHKVGEVYRRKRNRKKNKINFRIIELTLKPFALN